MNDAIILDEFCLDTIDWAGISNSIKERNLEGNEVALFLASLPNESHEFERKADDRRPDANQSYHRGQLRDWWLSAHRDRINAIADLPKRIEGIRQLQRIYRNEYPSSFTTDSRYERLQFDIDDWERELNIQPAVKDEPLRWQGMGIELTYVMDCLVRSGLLGKTPDRVIVQHFDFGSDSKDPSGDYRRSRYDFIPMEGDNVGYPSREITKLVELLRDGLPKKKRAGGR